MSTSGLDRREAKFYSTEGDKVRCSLCPHSCLIADKKRGLCGVRENRSGTLYSLIYGLASSIHPDPIEKKPLFHFYPGSTAISFGSIGCNLFCVHCQNYSISKARFGDFDLTEVTPEEVVRYARSTGARLWGCVEDTPMRGPLPGAGTATPAGGSATRPIVPW